MSWSEALQRFTLLTIGDGISAQLPALIVSVATGIIVTRSSADRDLSTEVYSQLSSIPRIPRIVAGALMVLLLLPGMPKWPILLMVGLLGLSWWTSRRARSADAEQEELIDIPTDPQAQTAHDGIEVLLGAELVAAFADKRALLLERIAMVRKAHFVEFGTPLPPVRIIDGDGTGFNDFEIRIFGVRFGMVTLVPDRLLAVANDDQNWRLAGIEAHDVLPGRSGFSDRSRASRRCSAPGFCRGRSDRGDDDAICRRRPR